MAKDAIFDKLYTGATRPTLIARVTSRGTPLDFSSGSLTIMFDMWDANSNAVIINQASATGNANGQLTYSWTTADTATAGTYKGRFRVQDANNNVNFYPEGYPILIIIKSF